MTARDALQRTAERHETRADPKRIAWDPPCAMSDAPRVPPTGKRARMLTLVGKRERRWVSVDGSRWARTPTIPEIRRFASRLAARQWRRRWKRWRRHQAAQHR